MSDPRPITVEEMYGEWPVEWDAVQAALDKSRRPRPITSLYDTFGALGIGRQDLVLDIGARDARHALELATRFACRVVAVEPVAANVRDAETAVAEHDHGDLVEIREGSIEAIPAGDGEFDAVWARDMLNHVPAIDAALGECLRVVKAGGALVVYQTFATSWLEPTEARRLYADLAIVPERMSSEGFETAATQAGFTIDTVDVIGSQWREALEEDGSGRTARQLLHAARLLRCRDAIVAEIGEIPYRVELGNALWGVYQMIGKLEPRAYVLRR